MGHWTKELTIKQISRAKFLRTVNCGVDLKRISGWFDPYFVVKQNLHPACNNYHGWIRGNHAYVATYNGNDFFNPELIFFRLNVVKGEIVLPWAHTRNSLDWDIIHYQRFLTAVSTGGIPNYKTLSSYLMSERSFTAKYKKRVYQSRLLPLNLKPVQKARLFVDVLYHKLKEIDKDKPGLYLKQSLFFKHLAFCINYHLLDAAKNCAQKRVFRRRAYIIKNAFGYRWEKIPETKSTVIAIETSKKWLRAYRYKPKQINSFLTINDIMEPIFMITGQWGFNKNPLE